LIVTARYYRMAPVDRTRLKSYLLFLMVPVAVLPLMFFKRKKWL
jgi:hypothetical protein